ncbi:MAG: hypothetical protein IH897_04945 [Planctomycetes bacterium]|nr:hypothetical protein [Planctomycetota bacterium]
MHDVNWLMLVSRWIHLAAAFTAVGGVAYARIALLPSAAEVLDDDAHAKLREAIRRRWSRVVHVCIGLLLLTGGLNFVLLALRSNMEPMPYHAIFGIKFLAAMAIFFLATALAGKAPGFAKMREKSGQWMVAILLLGGLIVLLSGVLNQVRLSGAKVTATPKNTAPSS